MSKIGLADIEQLKNKISYAIEQMTLQGMNLKNVNLERNDLSSQNGLLKEYKKLNIQLKQLQILEKKHATQLEQLKSEERAMLDDMQKYSQLDVSRNAVSSSQCVLNSFLTIHSITVASVW